MKLIADPKLSSNFEHTFDLEIGGDNSVNAIIVNDQSTHSYQIVAPNGATLVTHNTVSLLAGATPGVHFPISRCYIRRIRLSKDSDLIEPLRAAGFNIFPAVGSEKSTVVVEFPIKLAEGVRNQNEVSMWEKLQLTKFMQEHWADNQVSVTIDFNREKEGGYIAAALDYFQYHLKSVSFLPRDDSNVTPYPQMPYETISEEQCDEMLKKISPIKFPRKKEGKVALEDKIEKDIFCDGDQCVVVDTHRGNNAVSASSSLKRTLQE